MGAMSRLVLLAHRMIRILDMYFSIVRRSAACASRDSESASLIITTARQLVSNAQHQVTLYTVHTFESMLGTQIDLLRLGNFLQ